MPVQTLAGVGTEVEKVWAHLPEKCCVKYSTDGKYIYTGGNEGQVFVYSLEAGGGLSAERSERQRLHRGGVCDLDERDGLVASCATDGSMVVYGGGGLESFRSGSRMVFRASLPLKAVSVAPGGRFVACAGDNMELVIVDVSSPESQVVKGKQHNRPITDVAFDSTGGKIAAVDMSGTLRFYSFDGNAMQVEQIGGDVHVTLPPKHLPKLAWSPDGRHLAITMQDGIKIVSTGDDHGWGTEKHLLCADVHSDQIDGLCWSSNGCLLVSHDSKCLALWTPHGPTSKPWARLDGTECGVLCFDLAPSLLEGSSIDKEGNLTRHLKLVSPSDLEIIKGFHEIIQKPASATAEVKASSTPKSKYSLPEKARAHEDKVRSKQEKKDKLKELERKYISSVRDDDDEDDMVDEEEDGEGGFPEDEDEGGSVDLDNTSGGDSAEEDDLGLDSLDDYDIDEAILEEQKEEELPKEIPLVSFPVYKSFQPGATHPSGDSCFLASNLIGSIVSRKDAVTQLLSIDIDFHDKLSTRPVRLSDDGHAYSLGSLCRSAALLASEEDSALQYVAFEAWGGKGGSWTAQLAPGERPVSVAVDERGAYVATSHGWLRVFSPAGLPRAILTLGPGHLVSMAAGAQRLLLLFSHAGSLHAQLYNTSREVPKLTAEAALGQRADATGIKWIGISETGLSGALDGSGAFYVLCEQHGRTWTPLGDFSTLYAEGCVVWPLFFDRSELTAILCKNGPKEPAVLPKPIPASLPFQMPIPPFEDPACEAILRTSTLLSPHLLDATAGLREKDLKKLHTASDRHALALLQLALKAERQGRALEICGMFWMAKSFDLAIQLVRHHRLSGLAERIEALKDDFERRQREDFSAELSVKRDWSEPKERVVDEPALRTLSKRARVDLLADASELPSTESTEVFIEPVDSTVSESLPVDDYILPPVGVSTAVAEKKPRGLADMLSRLSSLASEPIEPSTTSKPHKENLQPPSPRKQQQSQKGLKQASLAGMFSKKPAVAPASTEPTVIGDEEDETQA